MDKAEAERVAHAIRTSGLPFVVRGVGENPHTRRYEVRAEYRGKSKRYRNHHLEAHIALRIPSPHAWAMLKQTALYGHEVK